MHYRVREKEKRRKPRIANKYLPQQMRQFKVAFEDGSVHPAETIDASESGIAFRLEVPIYNISDYNVSLTPSDKSFELKEEIVYIKPMSTASSRVCVHFSKKSNLNPYLKMLQKSSREG